MKHMIFVGVVVSILLAWPGAEHDMHAAATCVGATPCKACTSCKSCKRCSKDGGTCGTCRKTQ